MSSINRWSGFLPARSLMRTRERNRIVVSPRGCAESRPADAGRVALLPRRRTSAARIDNHVCLATRWAVAEEPFVPRHRLPPGRQIRPQVAVSVEDASEEPRAQVTPEKHRTIPRADTFFCSFFHSHPVDLAVRSALP